MFKVDPKYSQLVTWTIIAMIAMTIAAIIASIALVELRPYPELGEVFKGWFIIMILLSTFLVEPFIKGTPMGRDLVDPIHRFIRRK